MNTPAPKEPALETDIRRLREQLARLEDQLRITQAQLIDSQRLAQVGSWERDPATGKVLWTDEMYRIYGLSKESQVDFQTFLSCVHPNDREIILEASKNISPTTPVRVEFSIIRPDGEVRYIRSISEEIPNDDTAVRIVGTDQDITEQVRATELLRESERRVRLAVSAGVGLWDHNLRAPKPALSPLYSEVFGKPPSDPEQWLKLVHPEDRDRVMVLVKESIHRVTEWSTEFRVLGPDGRERWLLSKGTVLLGDDGRPSRMMGVSLDITERKQAEAALQESEERFRNMANTAPVMIWASGPDKLATFFNKPWLNFRGRTMEQELGRGYLEGVHPDDLDRCSAIYDAAFNARCPFQKECRLRRADGQYRWILDKGMPLYRSGDFAGFIGSSIDVTDQKLIEERLRASETRLLSAQRLANLGSWERDDVTGTTEFSDEMLRILGMPDNPPRTLAEFLKYVYPEDLKYVSEGTLRARSTGESVAGEYRIIRADGEIRLVRSVLQAIRDEQGKVIRVVGATQDITDLNRAQQESAARQKLESLGTLASGIAHDFNNLMGGVLAESELALAELGAGLHPKEELTSIRDVALRGSEIVRQLMVYAGQESATVGPVDLSRTVREMNELLKVSVSKHAVLETDLANNLPTVQADAAQIRQIVMNLVMNASEAIGNRDGVIRVATRRMSPGQDSSGIDYVQLEVSDTGCGMLPRVQARVFDPFFTTKSAGHGLGLAIVDGIVRRLEGNIHLASELGKGTTFQISLPCVGVTTGSEPLSSVEEAAHLSESATVLIVEDEDVLRRAAAKALRRSGFEVLEAATGSAAIELLRARGSQIDVVLLDLTIPGPSSPEVVAEYAKTRSDAKVILTSAYGEEMARKTVSAPEVRGFIRKPFHLGVLAETLRNTLSS